MNNYDVLLKFQRFKVLNFHSSITSFVSGLSLITELLVTPRRTVTSLLFFLEFFSYKNIIFNFLFFIKFFFFFKKKKKKKKYIIKIIP